MKSTLLRSALIVILLASFAPPAKADGRLRFVDDSVELNVNEGAQISLLIERLDSDRGAVSVRWTVVPITAALVSDVPNISGSVPFADGEIKGAIEFTLPQDMVAEHTETFRVELTATTNATLDPQSSALVRIKDDDWAGDDTLHYVNRGTYDIPAHANPASGEPSGPAPIPINVSDITRVVTNVIVKVSDLSHERVTDLDLILESPTGRFCKLLSDYGDGERTGEAAIGHLNLCFNDLGARPDPSDPLTSRIWTPSDHDPGIDNLVDLRKVDESGTGELAGYNRDDPNGTWKLHVIDDFQGTGGTPPRFTGELIGGWELILELEPECVLPTIIEARVLNSATVGFFFTGPEDETYVWERSPDLKTWIYVRDLTATGGLQQLNGSQNAFRPRQYWRFRKPRPEDQ